MNHLMPIRRFSKSGQNFVGGWGTNIAFRYYAAFKAASFSGATGIFFYQ